MKVQLSCECINNHPVINNTTPTGRVLLLRIPDLIASTILELYWLSTLILCLDHLLYDLSTSTLIVSTCVTIKVFFYTLSYLSECVHGHSDGTPCYLHHTHTDTCSPSWRGLTCPVLPIRLIDLIKTLTNMASRRGAAPRVSIPLCTWDAAPLATSSETTPEYQHSPISPDDSECWSDTLVRGLSFAAYCTDTRPLMGFTVELGVLVLPGVWSQPAGDM